MTLPRVGSDWWPRGKPQKQVYFNPRSPCGERQTHHRMSPAQHQISIHAPRVGSDVAKSKLKRLKPIFQSTLPVWGATCSSVGWICSWFISIHAPRVGSDCYHPLYVTFVDDFNPRSPCGERLVRLFPCPAASVFQSTLPVWGATIVYLIAWIAIIFQSTLPVWGATRPPSWRKAWARISIHAPRVGSDAMRFYLATLCQYFNPRSPCGERRYWHYTQSAPLNFNPRSPCGERRHVNSLCAGSSADFNPRSPCGERLRLFLAFPLVSIFQSTLPVWGATPGSLG